MTNDGFVSAGGVYDDGPGEQAFVVDTKNDIWRHAVKVAGTAALNLGRSGSVAEVSCAKAGSCAIGGFYRAGDEHYQGS